MEHIENNWCDKCGEYCDRDFMYPVGELHYCPDCYKEHRMEAAADYLFDELGKATNPDTINPEQI